MLYSAVRFAGKSNLPDFEGEGHFLLEARKNLVYRAVVAFSRGLPWFRSWLSGWFLAVFMVPPATWSSSSAARI